MEENLKKYHKKESWRQEFIFFQETRQTSLRLPGSDWRALPLQDDPLHDEDPEPEDLDPSHVSGPTG